MMYYFVPKQAERPVYSYRLSIVHFWALISLYIWAGPHHLHYTALPDCIRRSSATSADNAHGVIRPAHPGTAGLRPRSVGRITASGHPPLIRDIGG